ncbi:MAG: oxidoreductase [Spirochaetae bacterium HGW-Spirochaetae-8]|nr:MAG: oxidoreductase [Spirochaetae bacterium HGW-Spirochaetae-8]
MKSVRYGIIGTGYFGTALAKALAGLDDASITWVYDPLRGPTIASVLNCKVAGSLEELVSQQEVDCVIVATPNGKHAEPVVAAARHGKHVFCEKPLDINVERVKWMLQAVQEAGVTMMAGHIMSFMNGVNFIKRRIAQGAIGEILSIHSERTGWEDPKPEVSWKKLQDISGGHLFHHIHELDFIQSLIGPAQSVYAAGGNLAHTGEGFGTEDDTIFSTFTFNGGRNFAYLETGSAFRMGQHFVRINGSRGAILLDMKNTGCVLKSDQGIEYATVGENAEEDRDRTYLNTYQDGGVVYGKHDMDPPLWLRSLIKKEMTYLHQVLLGNAIEDEFAGLFNGTAALASVKSAEAALQSLRTGTVQKIV